MVNKNIGARMRTLRESMKLSQVKIAAQNGSITQSAINRYETGKSEIPNEYILWYANFFDVSLDYIYCRTDEPQGKLYKFQPKLSFDDKQLEEFVEMCFEPGTPANNKLKAALITMLKEGSK